jgi:hypothetical protein
LNSIWVCESLPLPSPPIVHDGPNSVVLVVYGYLVLANWGLHLTGEGPQGIFYFAEFWEAKQCW